MTPRPKKRRRTTAATPSESRVLNNSGLDKGKTGAVVDAAKMDSDKPFRIMDLPSELRIQVYSFILPKDQRIFLDHKKFYRPLPYRRVPFPETFSLMQLNKKIRYEASEYVFGNNIINIIEPLPAHNFLKGLGEPACMNITTLECHISRGLGELGQIWKTMNDDCPKLEHLRLVFYHDEVNWAATATQIAYHIHHNCSKQKEIDTHNKPQTAARAENVGLIALELELYDSIWAHSIMTDPIHETIDKYFDMQNASAHAKIYSFDLPKPLRKITVTASVGYGSAWNLISEDKTSQWKEVNVAPSLNGVVRTLRWLGMK